MENQESTYLDHFFEDDEAEDTLSFCNLPLGNGNDNSLQESPRASSYQEEPFEFSNGLNPENRPTTPNALFCGNFFHQDDEEKELLNEYKKRDYLAMVKLRSASSGKPSYNYDDQCLKNEKERGSFKNRSSSSRIDSYYNSKCSDSKCSVSNVQKVNITTLTSMSAKSRRRMFMFGPVKFMPEMELSSIKQRQGKLAPMTVLSQVMVCGEKAVNGGGKAGKSNPSRWGLLKSFRSRSPLATMLARSFGCIPVAGVERWISV